MIGPLAYRAAPLRRDYRNSAIQEPDNTGEVDLVPTEVGGRNMLRAQGLGLP